MRGQRVRMKESIKGSEWTRRKWRRTCWWLNCELLQPDSHNHQEENVLQRLGGVEINTFEPPSDAWTSHSRPPLGIGQKQVWRRLQELLVFSR